MKDGNSFNLNALSRNYDAAESVSRHPSDALKLFYTGFAEPEVNHGFAAGESFAE